MPVNPLDKFRFVGAVEDDTLPQETTEKEVPKEVQDGTSLSDKLQTLLCDIATFYHFVHESHWNVRGDNFYEYHKFFDEIVSDTYDSIDPIAENIRKLGKNPAYRMSELVKGSTLKEPTGDDNGTELLAKNVASLNQQIVNILKSVFDTANEVNEQGVANFIAERIDMHQKWQWFLDSSIGT